MSDLCWASIECPFERSKTAKTVQRYTTRLPFKRTWPWYEERLLSSALTPFADLKFHGDLIFTFEDLNNCFGDGICQLH